MPCTRHIDPPLAAILIVPVIAALVLTLFAWPSARIGPRDLPVGVVGTQQLPAAGGFEIHRYRGDAVAREAIKDREVYGALVGSKVLVASAAPPAVARMLTQRARGMPVEDVVPATNASNALAASVFPLVLAGIMTGTLTSLLAAGVWRRTALAVAGSVLAGLAATLILQDWHAVVGGDWRANGAALSLAVLAIASVVTGLEALVGRAGILAGALTMILVGNPFSGVATSPEMPPTGAGTLGRLLPPGAGGNLLRSTGFFDGAGSGGHVAVPVTWTLTGVALLGLAALRGRRRPPWASRRIRCNRWSAAVSTPIAAPGSARCAEHDGFLRLRRPG